MTVHVFPRADNLDDFLAGQRSKDVLRFITCGSVDDGKSTLIGRLLHDSKQLFDDQLTALERDSRRHGTQGEAVDFALLVDGLSAEREQGITIDVAYRFFSTDARSFIVADTPGHEQYTRNMATGASTADLAVLLIDARKGLSRQTRRHSLLVSMLGIRHLVLAINKMDLVGWSQGTYETIMSEYRAFAADLGFEDIVGIPLSALSGDNVVHPAVLAPWHKGPTLLQHLDRVRIADRQVTTSFRMPVQWVNRRQADFRGFSGFVTGGAVAVGERVKILPSGLETTVARIVTYDGDLKRAIAGQSVTLTLADEVDVSRGDVIAVPGAAPFVTSRIATRLFWSGDQPLRAGDNFLLKLGTAQVQALIEEVQHRIDPDTAASAAASMLEPNEIGDVVIKLDRAIALDAFDRNRDTGSFILIDRERFDTVALGLVAASQQDEDESVISRETSNASKSNPKGWLKSLWLRLGFSVIAGVGLLATVDGALAQTQLLNVSYDPTRELYREINQAFAQEWKKQTGEVATVRTSHGGSGAQARAVIDGVDADVVTLGIPSDIDAIAKLTKKIPADWRSKLPNNSLPYTSTVVFLVRKGNPKGIKDWDDLARPGVQVITPNPKTSAGGRWNFLAAWGYVRHKDGSDDKAKEFVTAIYKNVPVLDTGARGSTVTFAQRGLGDVLPAWENEAFLVLEEFGKDKFEVVVPSVSILAEPPVALVEGNADAKGTRKIAEAYLQFLYSDAAQAIFAKHHYRPIKREAAAKDDLALLPDLKLFSIESLQPNWDDIQKLNFESGGLFDQISKR